MFWPCCSYINWSSFSFYKFLSIFYFYFPNNYLSDGFFFPFSIFLFSSSFTLFWGFLFIKYSRLRLLLPLKFLLLPLETDFSLPNFMLVIFFYVWQLFAVETLAGMVMLRGAPTPILFYDFFLTIGMLKTLLI